MLKRTPCADKPLDLFISYKSTDANLARRLCEHFTASGWKVWFAEYNILLKDREAFEQAIVDGIRASRYGLCLTHSLYAASPYCCSEMERLLQPEHCGAERVIEVRLASASELHERFPELRNAQTIQYQDNPADIVRFVEDALSRKAQPYPECDRAAGMQVWQDPQLGYTLDLDGWSTDDSSVGWDGSDYIGISFSRELDGHSLTGNVIAGQHPVASRQQRWQILDDREAYLNNIEFATEHIDEIRSKIVGVHLLWLQDTSHLGLTYYHMGGWARRYSVVLPQPGTGQEFEFAFIFQWWGPLDTLCLHSGLIDELMLSLRWT